MSELQGFSEQETQKVIPKMINGKRQCEQGYALKMDEKYRNTVNAIRSRNWDNKNKSLSSHTNGLIAGLVIFVVILVVVLLIARYGKGHGLKLTSREKGIFGLVSAVLIVIIVIFLWQVIINVEKDKKSNDDTSDPEPIPAPKEGDYYCKKITVEAKGKSSGGFYSIAKGKGW